MKWIQADACARWDNLLTYKMQRTCLIIISIFNTIVLHAQQHKIPLITYGGIPEGIEVQVLYQEAFITGYSNELKNPLWVTYRVGNVKGSWEETDSMLTKWERPYSFQKDVRTTAQVTHDDYTSTGYDRGHMAPNAIVLAQYGQMAQMETYLMSNITPQTPALNRGIWQRLEEKVRTELSQDDTKNKEVHDLYVITGPIFSDNPAKLESGIPIPEACYKIIAFKRGYFGTIKAIAFLFPQNPTTDNFEDYIVTVDAIEAATGLNFFPELTDVKQHNLESKRRSFNLEDF
jgi:endonuclease G